MDIQYPLILTLILFFVMVLQAFTSKIKNRNSKLPPGPWPKLPIIGHLHHLLGLPHHTLRDLAKKHGSLMYLQLGEVPMFVISSAKLAKEMMKTHDMVFADRPSLFVPKIISYDCISIVFSPYGGYWRQLRKICSMELLSAKKVQSFCSLREEELTNLIKKISLEAGSPVNITNKLYSVTNDITSRAAFGKKCKQKETFLSFMHEAVALAGGFDIPDLFPSLKFLHGLSGIKAKIERVHEEVDKILQDIINEHRVNRNRDTVEDLVDVLLRVQGDKELEFPIEDNNIKAVILDLFTAGSDTSTITLEWALSELMRNPRVMEKAQTEVRHVLNGKEHITQSDTTEMNYLSCVIKETLRLHPPAPLLAPRLSRERCEIDGYEIPKGTRVVVNAWAIARDPEYWSDPERFLPERFEDVSIDYKGNNFNYLPFGGGRRICPGILFAMANIELPLAQLLYHFDWKLAYGIKSEELDMKEYFGASVGRLSNLHLIPTPYSPPSSCG